MAHSEDHTALAAEYALGTLDAEERARVEAMMAADEEFRETVQAWELRLGSLNQMVGPIEPRPVVWENIKAAVVRLSEQPASLTDPEEDEPPRAAPIAAEDILPPQVPIEPVAADDVPSPQVPVETVAEEDVAPQKAQDEVETTDDAPPPEPPVVPAMPEDAPHPRATIEAAAAEFGASSPQAPAEPDWAREVALPPTPAVDGDNVVDLAGRVRRWRSIASVATAIAAALLVMVGLQAYRPDLLPAGLRPRTEVAEVKTPAPASGQYVAVLQQTGNSPAFILTVDAATKNFTVRRVGAQPEAGKSYELWLISDRLSQPRSLGVIGADDFTARPVLSSFDSGTINGATYAVTVEPAGGSPSGAPTSAPVFSGKLIESVPAGTATPPGNTK